MGMLTLRRGRGDWVNVTHVESGHVLEIRVLDLEGNAASATGDFRVNLAFRDAPHHFDIQRPERGRKAATP